jgi:hypothetical protein
VSSGTTGQVLTSQGAGAAPVFATPGGGAWQFITSVTASSSSTIDVENAMTEYDVYVITVTNLVPSTDAVVLAQVKLDGTYQSSNYAYHTAVPTANSTTYSAVAAASASQFQVSNTLGRFNNQEYFNLFFYIFKPSSSSLKGFYWDGVFRNDNPTAVRVSGAGHTTSSGTSALTGVRFKMASGNINSGVFRLYGIKNS